MYENIANNINLDDDIDWKDPIASKIITDNSDIIKNLDDFDKNLFMVGKLYVLLTITVYS